MKSQEFTPLAAGERTTRSADETYAFGQSVGGILRGGEIFLLDGGLGAGKTIFAKGLASALGIDPDEVTSPSFTLVNRYAGRLTFYHLDLYRLAAGSSAAEAVGLDDILEDEKAVVLIEWGERLRPYPLPPTDCWQLTIGGDGDEPRRIFMRRCAE